MSNYNLRPRKRGPTRRIDFSKHIQVAHRCRHGTRSRPLEHQGLERDRPHPAYLSRRPGRKKGDLSKFIEEAVRWRVFHRTVQDIKERNADTDPDELQRIIDGAVSEVRAERYAKGKADKA